MRGFGLARSKIDNHFNHVRIYMKTNDRLLDIEAAIIAAIKSDTWAGTRDRARTALFMLQAFVITNRIETAMDDAFCREHDVMKNKPTHFDGLVDAAPAAPAVALENTPNTLGGFVGAFYIANGRRPTEQEIFDAGVRSGMGRAAPAPAEPKGEQQAGEPCNACQGSGWVTRDPDIGTDQECCVCDGTGTVEPEQRAATLTTETLLKLFDLAHRHAFFEFDRKARALLAAHNGGKNAD
jgi:hypothetical protein